MAEEGKQQTLTIVSQYIKDLSFENITPMSQNRSSGEQPNIDVQLKIDVKNGASEGLYTISLITEITAKQASKNLFLLELNYTGEFVVSGFPANVMDLLLRIECPRLLFPFARSIIANAVSDGGFPPLYIEPVDFAALYQQQMQQQKQSETSKE
jgi:preprotein translocase subunit SecB